jgi:hypothetical protein
MLKTVKITRHYHATRDQLETTTSTQIRYRTPGQTTGRIESTLVPLRDESLESREGQLVALGSVTSEEAAELAKTLTWAARKR